MRDRGAAAYTLVSVAETAYPRRGQPIVPRLLAGLLERTPSDERLDADVWNRRSRAVCRQLAIRAVRRLRAVIDDLPRRLTGRRMPDPAALLKALLLDTRTRNVLARSLPDTRQPGRWTVGRYLTIPGFGARCLLDVLTSLEASAKSPKATRASGDTPAFDVVLRRIEGVQRRYRRDSLRPAPPALAPDLFADAAYLAKVIALIVPELPLSEEAVRARLEAARIASAKVELARLVKAASRIGLEPPFAILTQGGAKIAIRRRDISQATGAYAIAARTTYNWGVMTVAAVASQLAAVTASEVDPRFVAKVLSAVQGFEWLEQETGWFWFRTRPSRLMEALAKIFSVVTTLSMPRLYWALFKGHDEHSRPPPPVVGRLAQTLPGAQLDGERVTVPRRLDRSIYLSAEERSLVEILETKDGALSAHALRGAGASRALPARTILGFLRLSPLLEVLPDGRCCLIGAPVGEPGRLAPG